MRIFYRENLRIEEVAFKCDSAELICLKLYDNENTIILAAFYRPPNQNVNLFNDGLERLLSMDAIKKVFMLGDIDICYLTEMYGANNYLNVLN